MPRDRAKEQAAFEAELAKLSGQDHSIPQLPEKRGQKPPSAYEQHLAKQKRDEEMAKQGMRWNEAQGRYVKDVRVGGLLIEQVEPEYTAEDLQREIVQAYDEAEWVDFDPRAESTAQLVDGLARAYLSASMPQAETGLTGYVGRAIEEEVRAYNRSRTDEMVEAARRVYAKAQDDPDVRRQLDEAAEDPAFLAAIERGDLSPEEIGSHLLGSREAA